jgi:hypothetical protein
LVTLSMTVGDPSTLVATIFVFPTSFSTASGTVLAFVNSFESLYVFGTGIHHD